MTFLEIIQRACRRVGLTAPDNAIGSTDENIVRMIELANEEGEGLSERYPWQALVREATHTTLATEDQGSILTIAGADFSYIVQGTFWNRTANQRWNPVTQQDWQTMKSSGIAGPTPFYRVRGNKLLAMPVPTAGQTLAFEWVTNQWCQDSGGDGQESWEADTDVPRLPGKLMLQGLVWRWKKAQGLEYAEDFNQYEAMLANMKARDGAKGTISLRGPSSAGTNVPEGNWDV